MMLLVVFTVTVVLGGFNADVPVVAIGDEVVAKLPEMLNISAGDAGAANSGATGGAPATAIAPTAAARSFEPPTSIASNRSRAPKPRASR